MRCFGHTQLYSNEFLYINEAIFMGFYINVLDIHNYILMGFYINEVFYQMFWI